MNLYTMVGGGIGSHEAAGLRTRLVAWHDAMVAHERKIRAGRTERGCDDECPHAEAQHLWSEAVETFGEAAHELTFLRTRAMDTAKARRVDRRPAQDQCRGAPEKQSGRGRSLASHRMDSR